MAASTLPDGRTRRQRSSGKSPYDVITGRILSLMDQGVIPWHCPWSSSGSVPTSLQTTKPYRGVNAFLLGCCSYELPYFATYKQAQKLGGNVRKGEKGFPVVFWKFDEREVTDSETGESETRTLPLLRYYTVFNVAQCDGLEETIAKLPRPETRQNDPIESAEAIVMDWRRRDCPAIEHGSNGAYYVPKTDMVRMPDREYFDDSHHYYSTLFHELTHAAGHESRLNRKADGALSHRFGSPEYSREELVAEMGAAFLSGHAGILHRTADGSASYIQTWRDRLASDNRLVVIAAAQAQKAADYILNLKYEAEDE